MDEQINIERDHTPLHSNQKKRILLTGAAGFIGSNFLKYLYNKYPDYHFMVLDCLTYAGNPNNIPNEIKNSDRYEFWYGSVTNTELVGLLMAKADWVVHFAAETHVARSIFDNTKFFETDVLGTQTLMNALMRHKQVEKFIHISTSEVYGSAIDHEAMNEHHELNPTSPYAGAKAGADRLVYSYWTAYDIPATIIRPFNNYGPNQHLEKLIPRFITSAIEGKQLTVHGDGTASRDWLYVDDHCEALDKVLHCDFSTIKNETINLGTGSDTSVIDIAKTILRLMDKPESLITYIPDRPGQVETHISSTEKAKKLLNWEAKTSIEDGLKQTIDWYKHNEAWWKELEWMKQVPIQTADGKVWMY